MAAQKCHSFSQLLISVAAYSKLRPQSCTPLLHLMLHKTGEKQTTYMDKEPGLL